MRELSLAGWVPRLRGRNLVKAITESLIRVVSVLAKWWQILARKHHPCQRETAVQPPSAGLGRGTGAATGALSVTPRTLAIVPIADDPRKSH